MHYLSGLYPLPTATTGYRTEYSLHRLMVCILLSGTGRSFSDTQSVSCSRRQFDSQSPYRIPAQRRFSGAIMCSLCSIPRNSFLPHTTANPRRLQGMKTSPAAHPGSGGLALLHCRVDHNGHLLAGGEVAGPAV